jgi:hypothetical protein
MKILSSRLSIDFLKMKTTYVRQIECFQKASQLLLIIGMNRLMNGFLKMYRNLTPLNTQIMHELIKLIFHVLFVSTLMESS